ncbi:HNH endonuclease [Sorangium sp. So ce131]|uniref:HNH endonuclease n=1 Tax=Sorangium sp. So ce131 TaxID=3133282 RepID=UPI003F5FFD94
MPAALRERVSRQAGHRCGYCLSSQELLGMPMTIDHLLPEAAGGPTVEENLWLSCSRCNQFKGAQTSARDPETGESVPLFNPRRDLWGDHFGWDHGGFEIVGKTARGRATRAALRLNNPEILAARRLWVAAGWWPPRD